MSARPQVRQRPVTKSQCAGLPKATKNARQRNQERRTLGHPGYLIDVQRLRSARFVRELAVCQRELLKPFQRAMRGQNHCREGCGLTFDMRGGRKWAKPTCGRPLDGRVRPLLHLAFAALHCDESRPSSSLLASRLWQLLGIIEILVHCLERDECSMAGLGERFGHDSGGPTHHPGGSEN